MHFILIETPHEINSHNKILLEIVLSGSMKKVNSLSNLALPRSEVSSWNKNHQKTNSEKI